MARLLLVLFVALTTSAWGAAYDRTQTTDAYTLRLRVPTEAMADDALKADIFARFAKNSAEIKSLSTSDKATMPEHFHPYALDTLWRVNFENKDLLSLSGYSFVDENGAHPNAAYDSILWDKHQERAISIADLFANERRAEAFAAIASKAKAELVRFVSEQEGTPADPSLADEGIGADSTKLSHFALSGSKDHDTADGIVLLYGAGEAWAHVLGDVKLFIPASVFHRFLSPRFQQLFH